MKKRFPAGIFHAHCGCWHYGYSYIDTHSAIEQAQREVEKCEKQRVMAGLEPEQREASHAG